MQQERMRTLATPKQGNRMLIFVGYVSCLLPLSLNALHFEQAHVYDNFPKMNFLYFPVLWGLIIGWTFMWSFTTLPDGRRIAAYDEHARQQGRIILTINLLAWATSLLLFVGGNLQA
jgi:hypothetical protein